MIFEKFMYFHMSCAMDFNRIKGYNYIDNFVVFDKGAAE